MSSDTNTSGQPTHNPAGPGDNSLRNFFVGLVAVSAVVIAIVGVIEQTAG